jgi:hypothetical protein
MPAAIILKDRAGGNVTFNHYSDRSEEVEWVEAGATSLLGTSRARLSRKVPANKASGVLKTILVTTRPVVNATTGALDGIMTMKTESFRPANISDVQAEECVARHAAHLDLAGYWIAVRSGALPA